MPKPIYNPLKAGLGPDAEAELGADVGSEAEVGLEADAMVPPTIAAEQNALIRNFFTVYPCLFVLIPLEL
jgi:hypothetical protein